MIVVRFGLCVAWVLMSNVANGGELIAHTIDSERLAGNLVGESTEQRVLVQLPAGYEESQEDYPVVYWFPGGGLSHTSGINTKQLDEEFISGRSDPAIIVFMPGMTSFGSTVYMSSEAFGDWEGFLTDEVIPLVDNTYRTQATPNKRGVMGFSLGGFTALTLPLLVPNTFGAVAGNDPGITFVSGLVRDSEEIPEGVVIDEEVTLEEFLEEFFGAFPDSIEGFKEASLVTSGYGQVAARLSPNPDAPLLGDIPFDRQGQWIPETRAQWQAFDLLNPASIELHKDSLKDLTTVSVILPDAERGVETPWTREMIQVLRDAGIPAQGIDAVGDHNDSPHKRFTALLSNVTYALNEDNPELLGRENYGQGFDEALGIDDANGVSLPTGWSVSDGFAHVFRDRTNTPFAGGNIEIVGEEPFILNAGGDQDTDRALAVYLPQDSEGVTIQFLADVSAVDANSLQLKFDVEAFESDGAVPTEGDVALHVTAEFDFGNGFEQLVDVGDVSIFSPSSGVVDPESGEPGTGADLRVSFASGFITAPINEALALRLRWATDTSAGGARSWLLGLDDVELSFLLWGDFDGDSILNASDIDLLSAAMLASDAPIEFDLNGDALVDELDREHWVHGLVGSTFGDANLDQSVDFSDFLSLAAGFGMNGGWAAGDFDGSGEVEFGDFLVLSRNFSQPQNINTVPEPSSSMLLIMAAVFAVARASKHS